MRSQVSSAGGIRETKSGTEEDFAMGREATGRSLERRWMKSGVWEGSGGLKRKDAEGLGKAKKV